MPNEAPQFIPRLAPTPPTGDRDEALWEASIQSYGEGAYARSVSQLVRYLDPGTLAEEDDVTGRTLVLAHGSVRLHLSVTAERLSIRVPFLHVPEGGRAIALMRKSLEVSSHLVLASFRLEDDTLIVRYEDKLAGCHPAKLLDVMSCICKVVDSCDDLFAKKFSAERAEPHGIATWSGERLREAHQAFTQVLTEALQLADRWDAGQNLIYAYYALDMGLERLTVVLRPQGYVRSELNRIGGKLRNKSRAPAKRISDGRKSLDKLAALTEEELKDSLYDATFIIPDQRDCALGAYQGAVRELLEKAISMGHDRRHDQAVTMLLHSIYEDLSRWRLPTGMVDLYWQVLRDAGGLPWRQASEVLLRGFQAVAAFKESGPPAGADYYRDAMATMQPHLGPKLSNGGP